MKCPKCGEEMTLGKINIFYGSSYPMGSIAPFWAEKSYFTKATFPNAKDAEKKGIGFRFPAPHEKIDIAYTNLPEAFACKSCKVILLECGKE
ncbi:MAG: PF20097 family protein [Oscillospiraceae bacterium]|nr:PF20097 family protein [Oscillospiraceae bacterium]